MGNRQIDCRVQALLMSGDVYHTLDANREMLFAVIPELRPMVGYVQVNPYHCRDLWDHTIYSVSQVPPDPVLRLVMLLHDIGKLSTRSTDANGIDHFYGHPQISVELGGRILERLGVGERDCLEILKLIALHDEKLPSDLNGLQLLAQEYGAAFLIKLLQVKRADALAQNPQKLATRITELEHIRKLVSAFPA